MYKQCNLTVCKIVGCLSFSNCIGYKSSLKFITNKQTLYVYILQFENFFLSGEMKQKAAWPLWGPPLLYIICVYLYVLM